MADLMELLLKNRDYIIIGSFVVGLLYVMGFLPPTSEFLSLGDNIVYVYAAALVLGGYLFFDGYFGKSPLKKNFNIQRTVPVRDLSDPSFKRNVERQRGPTSAPSKEFVSKFDREE